MDTIRHSFLELNKLIVILETLKVDSKKSALKLKESIKQQIEDGKLDKLKVISACIKTAFPIKLSRRFMFFSWLNVLDM